MAKKILIVDDEPDIAEVLGDRLEAEGFDVRIVNRADACYRAVAEEVPDLILLDVQMPEISGIEALGQLKTHHPQVPVLMVSAATTREVMEISHEKGAAGFLLKPFEPVELMRQINVILGGK